MKLRTVALVLATAALLVLAVDPSGVAAAVKGLVLGTSNTASSTTTLQNTGAGPALSLKARPGKAPLAVGSTVKVAKLNADQVDGKDASALGTRTTVWTLPVTTPTTSLIFTLPLSPGHYLVAYSAYLKDVTNDAGDCYFGQWIDGVQTYVGESVLSVTGPHYPGLSGSAAVEQTAGGVVKLYCTSGTAFTTFDNEPVQVIATRIASYTDGGTVSADPRPLSARGHR